MTTPDRVANPALVRALDINERIKHIDTTAVQVNIMALNAILLAKRAGAMALGFGVLSKELREFIRKIEDAMARLRSLTQETVQAVSEDARHDRIQRSLQAAARLALEQGAKATALEPVLASGQRFAEVRRERAATLQRSMRMTLQDAEQLGQFGLVLARTARIEAAYGGEFSASLMHVALEFDATIQEIMRSIDALRSHAQGGRNP